MNPYPGTVSPEPNSSKLLLTQDTILPSLSAVDRTMVSPRSFPGPRGPVLEACSGSTWPHSDAAYDFARSFLSGTSTNCGSALYRYRSRYASFLASTKKCQYGARAGPKLASVWPGAHSGTQASRMLSISSAAQACDGGGSSAISKPR